MAKRCFTKLFSLFYLYSQIYLSHEDDCERPWNFSWIIDGELAAMGWPESRSSVKFLIKQGIKHLVTLSREATPPFNDFDEIQFSGIDVNEFEAPTLDQIHDFIDICEKCRLKKEPVGVHCLMGRGRTGVMVACYLMRFHNYTAERAITELRRQRPGSVETKVQERAIFAYRDWLRTQGNDGNPISTLKEL